MSSTIDEESIQLSIKIGGKEVSASYILQSVSIRLELSKISSATLTFHLSEEYSLKKIVTTSVNFSIGDTISVEHLLGETKKSLFEGILLSKEVSSSLNESKLIIECKSNAYLMSITHKSEVFSQKTDQQIMEEILSNYSLTKQVSSTTTLYPELVQYCCSDWDFINSRAELNGMVILTYLNSIVIKAAFLDKANAHSIPIDNQLIQLSLKYDGKNSISSFSINSWDNSAQKFLETTKRSTLKSKLFGEVTTQTSSTLFPEMAENFLNAMNTRNELAYIKGELLVYGRNIFPGDTVGIEDTNNEFTEYAYVKKVEHRFEQNLWKTRLYLGIEAEPYSSRVHSNSTNHASLVSSSIKGLSIGKVKQLHQDPDGQYRIKVSYLTNSNSSSLVWARLTSVYASGEAGVFFYPEVDDEVILGFLNEDSQNPIILGALHSSSIKPPLIPETGNYHKKIQTISKLSISFDDHKKILELTTPKNSKIILNDDENSLVLMNNGNEIILNKNGISMITDKEFKVSAKSGIVLQSEGDISIESKKKFVGKANDCVFDSKISFVSKAVTTEVNGTAKTTIKGGIVMIN